MDQFQTALAIGALITAMVAFYVPRALVWIMALVTSFALATWWQKAGFPYREVFGAGTDFMIVLALFWLAEKRWELRVFWCVILMMMIDTLRFAGLIEHYWTIVGLEFANWLALISIFHVGLAERADDARIDFIVRHGRLAGYFHRAVHEDRKGYSVW
jgi:hypothetical protein